MTKAYTDLVDWLLHAHEDVAREYVEQNRMVEAVFSMEAKKIRQEIAELEYKIKEKKGELEDLNPAARK